MFLAALVLLLLWLIYRFVRKQETTILLPYKDEALDHWGNSGEFIMLKTDHRQQVYNPSIHSDGSISIRLSTYSYCNPKSRWYDEDMFPLVERRPDLQMCCRISEDDFVECIPYAEDMRLFTFNGMTMGIFNRTKSDKTITLVICTFSPVQEVELHWDQQTNVEKNWVPFEFEGHLYFSYSLSPHVVLRHEGEGTCVQAFESESPYLRLRGGSPWLKVENGFVSVAHETIKCFSTYERRYVHCFLLMEPRPPFRIVAKSRNFKFPAVFGNSQDDIQFCCGLSVYPEDNANVYISYGVADCLSRKIRLPIAYVSKRLKFDILL